NLSLRSRKAADLPQVRIEVQDDGVGIPAELMSQMFEPFLPPRSAATGWDWASRSAGSSLNGTRGAST
ncbi:MAG: hypothetical protein M1423_04300, partial [Acidobacteria bacterium]|nr:hypothetical protein [Acidobacteriota bacterium]